MSVTNNINLNAASGKSFNYEDVFYAYLNMPWDNPYDENGQPVAYGWNDIAAGERWEQDPRLRLMPDEEFARRFPEIAGVTGKRGEHREKTETPKAKRRARTNR